MAAESVAGKTVSTAEIIQVFKAVPTGNISDAMDALGIARGVIHGLKPLSLTQPRTAGLAFIVKQMPRHQQAVGDKLAKHSQVIDELTGHRCGWPA